MLFINRAITLLFYFSIPPVGIFTETTKRKNQDGEENYHVAALILARAHSKGIINKNLVVIENRTLLGRTLNIVSKFDKFNSVWVSTDSSEIAEEAAKYGANVYRRVSEYATDTASSIDATKEFLYVHPNIDAIGLIQCTSPFIYPEDLETAFEMITKINYDSVFSVTPSHKLRWRTEKDGSVSPINFNPSDRPRRQQWSGEVMETGMFYFTKASFIRQGTLQGGRIGVVYVPQNRSLEIDTYADLYVARILAPYFDRK